MLEAQNWTRVITMHLFITDQIKNQNIPGKSSSSAASIMKFQEKIPGNDPYSFTDTMKSMIVESLLAYSHLQGSQ